jgi:hypothetical protein
MMKGGACVPPLPYLLRLEALNGLGPSSPQVPHGHHTRLEYLLLQSKATAMHHTQGQALQLHNQIDEIYNQIIRYMEGGREGGPWRRICVHNEGIEGGVDLPPRCA